MNSQFRNIDSKSRPQKVSIRFEKVLKRDDSAGRPDEMQDGFWPSKDPNAAGYVEPGKFASEMRKAKARMTCWNNDGWHYVGVICRAHVEVPIGGTSFTMYTIDSAGLWGIESDSGKYLDSVYEDEKSQLLDQLKAMGRAFVAL